MRIPITEARKFLIHEFSAMDHAWTFEAEHFYVLLEAILQSQGKAFAIPTSKPQLPLCSKPRRTPCAGMLLDNNIKTLQE